MNKNIPVVPVRNWEIDLQPKDSTITLSIFYDVAQLQAVMQSPKFVLNADQCRKMIDQLHAQIDVINMMST